MKHTRSTGTTSLDSLKDDEAGREMNSNENDDEEKDCCEDIHDEVEVDADVGNSSNSGSSHIGPRMCRKQKLACATGQTAGTNLTQQSAKYCLYTNWDDQ